MRTTTRKNARISSRNGQGFASGTGDKRPTVHVHVAKEDTGMRVTSALVLGKTDALLIDAQFARSEAHRLVAAILQSGRNLRLVYVTHAHPDHYFGAEVIRTACPEARIVALPKTVAGIRETYEQKLAAWQTILGLNAPRSVIIPEALAESSLELEGERLDILAQLQGDSPESTAVWIPSTRTLVASDTVFADTHVWTAATTKDERGKWLRTLDRLEALKPVMVIPGHCRPRTRMNGTAIEFTRRYLLTFERELGRAGTAEALAKTMASRFPKATLAIANEYGAKAAKSEHTENRAVVKGEELRV